MRIVEQGVEDRTRSPAVAAKIVQLLSAPSSR